MKAYDYFHGLAAVVIAAIILLLCWGCGPAVRDSEVYSAEIDFVEAAAEEQVVRGTALLNVACKCEEVMGQVGFVTTECHDLAETILVVKYRIKYHTEFMRYLGGIHDKRPPKDPPEIPDPSTLCKWGGNPSPEEIAPGEIGDAPYEEELVDGGADGGE